MFMAFSQTEIRGWFASVAVAISPVTFGIYLIHDNNQIRIFIWDILIKPFNYAKSPFVVIIVLVISIAVFIVCAFLEKIRLWLFEILHIEKINDAISKYITSIFGYIFRKIK